MARRIKRVIRYVSNSADQRSMFTKHSTFPFTRMYEFSKYISSFYICIYMYIYIYICFLFNVFLASDRIKGLYPARRPPTIGDVGAANI